MSVTRTLAVILAFVAVPVWAEQATRRGASEGKSGSSDTDEKRNHGESRGGSESRPTASSGRDHSSSSKREGEARPVSRPPSVVPSSPSTQSRSDAERRHPRPGTGSAYRGQENGRGHGGSTYSGNGRGRVLVGHYGPHYHGRLHYPHSCYDHRTSFIYYDTPYYRHVYHYYDRDGAIRVLVDPAEAQVYVDGYYAGVADDFDGIFQRLYVSPGRHDIALKLDGHRTQRFRIYVPRGRTLKLHHDMVRGEGEVVEDMTTAADAPVASEDDEEVEASSDASDDRGTVTLNVTPEDASVYVDGEFHGTGRNSDTLSLPPGRHQIEVVRPGFRTYEREIDVRPGRVIEIDVDLRRS